MTTPQTNSGTLTAQDVQQAHARLDRIEAQQPHSAWLLRCIQQAQQEAQYIIAQAKKLEREVQ